MRRSVALFRSLLPLLLLAGGTACSNVLGPSDPAAELALNRALWQQSGPTSYSFRVTRSCFCQAGSTGPVTIVVVNGVATEKLNVSGSPVDPFFEQLFTPVPGLFDLIQSAIDQQAAGLSVRYNSSLGYPESIAIDWIAGAVDDEVSYRVDSFEPAPAG